MPGERRQTTAIGDYAAIGDGRSVALISNEGSLDWLCWPRFDSAAIFCGLLDVERGGRWSIRRRDLISKSRRYVGRTNVLETRFRTSRGEMRLTDFMPIVEPAYETSHLLPGQQIVRILSCDAGEVEIDVEYAPRPGFAKRPPRIVDRGALGLRVENGGAMLTLHGDLSPRISQHVAYAKATLSAGDQTSMILTYSCESPEVLPLLADAPAALDRTLRWWENWSSQCTYRGQYADAVSRSTLALKLLEFPTSGAFVAAATTSLPERIGGELNWDYRYCWLRDASVIMEALCGTGYEVEAHTHSRLLCWVALDALVRLEERQLLHGYGVEQFRGVRDEIRLAIETESWIESERTYTNEPGKTALDAALMHLSLLNFEPASSDRMRGTYQRICRDLGAGGPLLYRNLSTGEPTEGAFGICGFWAVEFLAMGGGTLEEAQHAFEQMLAYANDVGLYAEEIDPNSGAALGNFPQAFTHVGLINAALAIERRAREDKAGRRKEI